MAMVVRARADMSAIIPHRAMIGRARVRYSWRSGDLSQSMGYTGQQTHPAVQQMMERGVKIITDAGRIAGCSCPDDLIPKFLGLGVQYFHGSVGRLLQQSSNAYLQKMRQAAASAGK